MPILTYLRSRWLMIRIRCHTEASLRLWRLSRAQHRRAGECLDRLEAEIAAGRVVLTP